MRVVLSTMLQSSKRKQHHDVDELGTIKDNVTTIHEQVHLISDQNSHLVQVVCELSANMGSISQSLEDLLVLSRNTNHKVSVMKTKITAFKAHQKQSTLTAEDKVSVFVMYIYSKQTTTTETGNHNNKPSKSIKNRGEARNSNIIHKYT